MKQFLTKKSSAGGEKCWINHLKNNGIFQSCLPPTANFTCWTSWLKATRYHAKLLQFYPVFIVAELLIAEMAYNSEFNELLSSSFSTLKLNLSFLSEHGEKIISMIEIFEIDNIPVGHRVYNSIFDFHAILEGGTVSVHFMPQNVALLNSADSIRIASSIELFMGGFRAARDKLRKHVDSQTASLEIFKSIRVSDTRQLHTLSRDITSFSNLPGLPTSLKWIFEEWARNRNTAYNFDENFDIVIFWEQKQQSLPILSTLASNYLRMPSGAAGIKRFFSLLKQLESAQRRTLSDEKLKDSIFCYCNSKHFNLFK